MYCFFSGLSAAILDFGHPVTLCSIRNNANDILFLKRDCSIWNFVTILSRTKDISTSDLAADNGRHLEIPTSG